MTREPAAGRSRLVGRTGELALLDAALDGLQAGQTGVVLLSGEAGIGKSALAQELLARARSRGHRLAQGRGAELETEMPYAAAIEALSAHVDEIDPDALPGHHRAELGTLFPQQVEPTATAGFDAERYRLHHAVGALLEHLARPHGLVLVLDDVHWLDDGSAELVAHLVRRRPAAPVLLVLAYRTGVAPAAVLRAAADAASDGAARYVELGPLGEEDAATLIGGDLGKARCRALYRESGGNPFYLLELAGARPGGDALARPGAAPPDIEAVAVPPAVRLAIAGELAELGEAERALIGAGAVLGDPFDVGFAADVAMLDAALAGAAVDDLVDRDLVRPTDVPRRLAFRHPIVRRAVYAWAGEIARADAHERASAVLALRHAPAAQRAVHVERSARAGDADAIAVLSDAARSVAPRAPGTAARWYAAALRLLPDSALPHDRLALLIPCAIALGTTGRSQQARDALTEALALVPPEWPAARVAIIVNIARVDHIVGRFVPARALLESALEETDDPQAIAALRLELGVALWYAREWEALVDRVRPALEWASAEGAHAVRAEAAALSAIAAFAQGRPDRALASLDEAQTAAAQLTEVEAAARPEAWLQLGYAAHQLERYDATIEHFGRLRQIARETGQGFFLIPALVGIGAAHTWLGRLGQAEEDLEEAVSAALLLDNDQARMWAMTSRAFVAIEQGDVPGALHAGQAAVEAMAATSNAMLDNVAGCFLGGARALAGDVDGGIAVVVEHGGSELERLEGPWRPYWASKLAEAELARGDRDAAAAWVARAALLAQQSGLSGRLGDATRARALLELADGRPAAARATAERAAGLFAEVGRALEVARCDVVVARAKVAAGERDAAVAQLLRSHATFEQAGALRDRDAVERALRGLGVASVARRGPGGAVSGPAALSPRELDVVALVTAGLTNAQIGTELFLSTKTVESHLTRIYAKLGVRSRAAVARAMDGAHA